MGFQPALAGILPASGETFPRQTLADIIGALATPKQDASACGQDAHAPHAPTLRRYEL